MGRNKYTFFYLRGDPCLDPYFSASGNNPDKVVFFDLQTPGIRRMYFYKGLGAVLAKFAHLSRFAHGMPLIPDPAGGQYKGILLVWAFPFLVIGHVMQDCPPGRRVKLSIRKQPGGAAERGGRFARLPLFARRSRYSYSPGDRVLHCPCGCPADTAIAASPPSSKAHNRPPKPRYAYPLSDGRVRHK